MGFGVEAGVGCLHLVEKARFFACQKHLYQPRPTTLIAPSSMFKGFENFSVGEMM